MTTNVGALDRAVRVVSGSVLIAAALGVIPLATGLAGHCGLYSALRIQTRPRM